MKRALFILGQLTDSDIEWMIENGSSTHRRRGEKVIGHGEIVEDLSIVLSGILEVVREDEDLLVSRIGSGEMIGEMSLIDSKPPSVSVIASETCKLYTIPLSRLRQKMEVDQGFAARLYCAIATFLSSRLRLTTSRLGYGDAQDSADEIDINVLSSVGQAGARFTRIVQRFSEI